MVFKQRTVQNRSKTMEQERTQKFNNDARAIQNLEWQLGTQETALKKRDDAARRHDALQLGDFIEAATHKKKQDIATIKAVEGLIGYEGAGWKLMMHQAEKNAAKGEAKGRKAAEEEQQKALQSSDFGASKITFDNQESQSEKEQEVKNILGKLGVEVGTLQDGIFVPNEEWTKQDEDNSATLSFLQAKGVIDKTNENLLVNQLSNTNDQTEALAGLSWLGERKGFKRGYAMHRAETFEQNFLTAQGSDTIPRTYTYKGEEYEYVPAELDDDYISQETPIPYLNYIDAYKNQVLAEAAASGLSDTYIQKYIVPVLSKKAGAMKTAYRTNWANAKNQHWIQVTAQELNTGYLEAMASNDPRDMENFRLLIPQYIRQNQAYAARLKIKDAKKEGLKLTQEALKSAAARSFAVNGDTGLDQMKDIPIPVATVPWVSPKLADKNGNVTLGQAFPKQWSNEKIEALEAEVINSHVENQRKIERGKMTTDLKAVEEAYTNGDPEAKDLETQWFQKYEREYPDEAKRLRDKSTLMRDTETGYAYLKTLIKDGKQITDKHLLFVNNEAQELVKKEVNWEDHYEPVALDEQVPKDRAKIYLGQLEGTLRKDVLGTVDKSALESGYTDRVLDTVKTEILPAKMLEIRNRYRENNESVPSPEVLMKEAAKEIMDEMIADNPDGGPLVPGKYTADPIKGLIHFDKIYNAGTPSLDKMISNDKAMFNYIRNVNTALKITGRNILDDDKWIPKNISADQFELNSKGEIDVLWKLIANDKGLNPGKLTPEEIRQRFAAVQKNPVTAVPPINWEQSHADLDDRIGISNIDVNDPKKTSRLIAQSSTTAPIWGTTSAGLVPVAFNYRQNLGLNSIELAKRFDEEIIPNAINYKQTNNTKATTSQVVAGMFLGVDLNVADWHRTPEVRKFCHDCRTGGLA